MKDNEILERIAQVIATTPVTDDLYFDIGNRILLEVIRPIVDEVKAGYEEKMFEYRRKHAKNH